MSTTNQQNGGLALVTGGTGLLGSHIAEQLVRRGYNVRALCRSGSDTAFLESIGAEIAEGDLTDAAAIEAAMGDVDAVYHAAARVGDWGPWDDFVRVTIDGTRHVLSAAEKAGVRRFLHISSISAYGHPNEPGLVLDETAPLGRDLYKWSYYSRAKVEAEKHVWAAHESGKLPVTVIRPSWLYGQRDRATMPRIIDKIRKRKVKLIGDGSNRLNVAHAGNVAEASIMAVETERAAGEAYNVCHDGVMTQGQYFNMIAKALGEPEVKSTVPYGVAYNVAYMMECFGHLFKTKNPPLVTRYAVWLMGRVCFFECNKAKEQLGWKPSISYEEGVPAAVQDYLSKSGSTAQSARGKEPVPA
ncbi:MAG: NAD-dependent epimerase/dehydratase family protein [Phycisphaerae bacterium]